MEWFAAALLEADLGCHIEGNIYGAAVKGDCCHILIVLFVIIDCRCLSLDCQLASAFQLDCGGDSLLVVSLVTDRCRDIESTSDHSAFGCRTTV